MNGKERDPRGLTDEELMQRYRLGDEEAFHELHRRHAPKIYGFLKRRLGHDVRVEDVFQETFLRLHRFRRRYDPTLPFVPWFFTICRNALLDSERKRKTLVQKEVDDALGEELPILESASEPLPFKAYLDGLSEREKQILTLHLEEGLSFHEVGNWLRITPSNARQLSSRAIKKLKAIWK